MDKLEQAMNRKDFSFVDDMDNPKIILHGKRSNSSQFIDGKLVKDFFFIIGETSKLDEKDFSMHYIHSYDRLVKWLNLNTEGGYNYYLELYENRTL